MASVEVFKSAVLRIRDILRGPGVSITGMDSMRHICLYLLSRYMTRNKVRSLGVPDEFAWENLIETAQTKNGGLQKALDYFYHKEEDSLVNHFDRLFGTEKFSFDVKNPQKHKEILEILNGVKMEDVDCQMDILGWVYEQHLKTGSSAARDLGQFFTDRFICSYMVKLCSPKFKSTGVPESVCDPSMGTGGFLTAYIKYFKEAYPDKPIDWVVQQKEIHGCDTDPKVAGVSRLNLFMESGGRRFENLLTHDSLYSDLPLTGYDVILANMPFGLKGIVHASCCERVKDLKIRGTKSEPLFLQLMMLSLKRGGRCAVVVPDGMLVNTSTLHNGTRKYLLDNFNLKRVIKMKGQFFMNTAIQPTILFFENTGKATESVEFWDVVADAKGAITESMLLSVPRAKFDVSSSFDLRRYQESDKPLANPAGFPMVKLEEIVSLKSGKLNTNRGEKYSVPYYCSNGVIGYVENHTFDGEYVITALDLSIGAVHYVSGKFATSQHAINLTSLDKEKLNNRYLYYWLKLNNNLLKNMSKGIKPGILRSDVANLQMPLPPLEIQNQIVATLDRIFSPGTTELSDTLKITDRVMDLVLANPGGATLEPIVEAQRLIHKSVQMVTDVKAQMVTDVKAQMAAVVKASCSKGEEKVLNEVCKTKQGFPFKSTDYTSEGLAVVKHNNIDDGYVSKSKKQDFIAPSEQTKDYKMVIGDIVVSMDFDCGKVGKVVEDGWVLNQRVCLIRSNTPTLSQEYLYWLLRFGGFYEKMQSVHTGTTIKHISGKEIEKALLKIPSLEIQTETLSYLNDLQTQLISLESLQKQSERNAKFILDSYLNKA